MLRTSRLELRRWRDTDRAPFAAISADPVVMEHFWATLTREQSDAMVSRIEAGFDEHGFGLWAVEERATGDFLGFVGLSVPSIDAPFMPAVEVGWRLARSAWGNGYATEAARASLAYAFDKAGLDEVVSMTATTNRASQAVMRRLGMTCDPRDAFDHPSAPLDSPLRRHVLWRMSREQWRTQRRLDPDRLDEAATVTAPDGSTVHLLQAVDGASTAVFELGPDAVAHAVRHPRVYEIWFVLCGHGEIWRRTPDGAERVDALEPQVSLTIPRGTSFQFRCTGRDPLRILGVTTPAWGGDEDAEHVEGHWPTAPQA